MLVAFDAAVRDKVVVTATGAGGFAELAAHLGDADVAFAGCGFAAGTLCKQFFLAWVGPAVGGMKKAKVSLQKQAVYNAFDGVSADVFAGSREELAPAVLAAAIAKAVRLPDVTL